MAERTLYQRVRRGRVPSRKDREGRIEVWVPAATDVEQSSTSGEERALALFERAGILLYRQLEPLVAENGVLRERAVRAEIENERLQRENEGLKHRLAEGEQCSPRPWWRRRWAWGLL
jgi:hypothetical protein